ncbi:NAD(P)-binding protein [Teratosphaeria nubilosa]|uniref:NAD(P)-binding protein n=1 Tax=Teratosphaeria nubilosa TaxID=161662 RepID=A0A6G1KSU2_9PEZI|nr:NAD(P)-binding protein [Teratosphaeria nubilosa]
MASSTAATPLTELKAPALFSLKDWVTVVTGGGTGLGLITATALAANGAKVYITGRRIEKLKDAEQAADPSAGTGAIIGIQMDVTDKASIAEGVKQITEEEKYINLLVNNAGVTSVNYGSSGFPQGSISDISKTLFESQGFDDWTWIYKVNVASYFFTSVAFLPLLTAARDAAGFDQAGSILNISSISGITKESQNGQMSYNASKAATISLTEQLAVDFKRPDLEIRVNTIAPGYFPSEMTPIDKDDGQQKEHFRTKWGIPFGRAGTPKDYAQAVLGLACNGYATGSTLVIDGGWLIAHA